MVFFRPKPPYHRIYNKDIILLTHPKENNVVKQRVKQKLYKKGHIISAFEFAKTWDYTTVMRHLKGKFHVVWGKLVCNHAYAGAYNDLRFSLKCLIKFYQILFVLFLAASLEILLPCGNKLVAPTFNEGQKLDGNLIQKVFKRAALYLRPSEPLQVSISH